MHARIFLAGLAIWASGAHAETTPSIRDVGRGEIRDLLFRAETLPEPITVQNRGKEVRVTLAADILFDFDKADIQRGAKAALAQLAGVIRTGAKGPVRIEGHTDAKGEPGYNQKLSEKRAAAVKLWLTDQEGLRGVTFTVKGFGARQPVAPNIKPDGSDHADGRQRNRRVEVVFARN